MSELPPTDAIERACRVSDERYFETGGDSRPASAQLQTLVADRNRLQTEVALAKDLASAVAAFILDEGYGTRSELYRSLEAFDLAVAEQETT